MSRLVITALAALLGGLPGCNPADDGVFKSGGNTEEKPSATLLVGANLGGAGAADATAVTVAASVTYQLSVKSASGASLCTGSASIQIMSNFSFQVPTASIQCLSLQVDLAGLLASGVGAGADASKSISASDDGLVLMIASVANAQFSPPRPLILGPIVQDPTKYANYTKSIATTVSTTDASGSPVSAPGTFNIKVNSTGTTYGNDDIGQTAFTNVIDWTMTTAGFQGVPSKNGLLFQSMEFFFNTRPIMIPKLVIKGGLADFISAAPGAGTGTGADPTAALVGTLTIELIATKYSF